MLERVSQGRNELLERDGLRARVRDELGRVLGTPATLSVGFPRLSREATERAPSAMVALGFTAPAPPAVALVTLDAALAANLVDRALGGGGQLGAVTAGAVPSEAECGVLAYLAAKIARHVPGMWIRDVYADSHLSYLSGVVWPVAVQWREASGLAQVHAPLAFEATVHCELGAFDSLAPEELAALEPGDLLISDALDLSVTTAGLSGLCAVRARGLDDVLHVLLDGERVRAKRAQPASARESEVFLRLSQASLGAPELAAIASGEWADWPSAPTGQVDIERAGQIRARGTLVRSGSALAVLIDHVEAVPEPIA